MFDAREQARLDSDCRGYILYLENIGIVNAAQRELVIDRLLALDARQIDIEQVKWVVLMVRSASPGRRTRCCEWRIWCSTARRGGALSGVGQQPDLQAAPRPYASFYGAEEPRHR